MNGTLIAQTGSASTNVGKVDITLKNDEIVEVANFTKKTVNHKVRALIKLLGELKTLFGVRQ
ncbi:hypothetical protein ACWF5S_11145 [Peribacillus butanolivorans]